MSLHIQTKPFFRSFKCLIYNSGKSSNRGVAEIIAAIILLGVTVTGGILVFILVQNSDALDFVDPEVELLNPNVIPNLKLSGYDTRDALNLYNIDEIDNDPSNLSLCASSCNPNEFIILKVRNDADVLVENVDWIGFMGRLKSPILP